MSDPVLAPSTPIHPRRRDDKIWMIDGSRRERNFRIAPLAFPYNLQCGGVAQVVRATVS
jgi:hypothetical protein